MKDVYFCEMDQICTEYKRKNLEEKKAVLNKIQELILFIDANGRLNDKNYMVLIKNLNTLLEKYLVYGSSETIDDIYKKFQALNNSYMLDMEIYIKLKIYLENVPALNFVETNKYFK